ncbi:MAG: indolepyruvate ferredoxin oxidoreductase subunit alpha, partial [Desulfovibrio sp.]|nr:indolepyruvate ferredoxin oxidoreductase subunit alpha [Desulfovibrio sp.]
TVRAYNVQAVTKALESMKSMTGVRVLIAKEPCVLYARRQLKKRSTQVAEVVQQGPDALRCLEQLACPAFYRQGENLAVDPSLCSGCMVCLQVAPTAFKARKR